MKVEDMKILNKGTIKAFFTLDLVKVKIKNCKLCQIEGREAFISGPDEKYTAKDGTVKYKKHIYFSDKELESKATTLALAEYRKFDAPTTPLTPSTDDDGLPF